MLPPIVYAFFGTCLAPGKAFELVLQLSLPCLKVSMPLWALADW